MRAKTLSPGGEWIVRSHIGWKREQNILYKGVETSPYQKRFKNLERKSERESSKRTISLSSEFGLLQMVSESDIERCAIEDPRLQRGGGL